MKGSDRLFWWAVAVLGLAVLGGALFRFVLAAEAKEGLVGDWAALTVLTLEGTAVSWLRN